MHDPDRRNPPQKNHFIKIVFRYICVEAREQANDQGDPIEQHSEKTVSKHFILLRLCFVPFHLSIPARLLYLS